MGAKEGREKVAVVGSLGRLCFVLRTPWIYTGRPPLYSLVLLLSRFVRQHLIFNRSLSHSAQIISLNMFSDSQRSAFGASDGIVVRGAGGAVLGQCEGHTRNKQIIA